MNRGGEEIKSAVLFGKYQIIRILGKGRSGTVYLARHLELEELRAIKEVPKSCACYDQFKKEALLLKRLRHPGIPIVYDLEEEEHFSYLIEEFLEGDSFYDLVKQTGHLNQDTVIRYGIQICDLVHYLHSAETIPILYLDLQPRNLLVCHEQVKLLDFDHAGSWTEVNFSQERYGTPGYCAPEQQEDKELGVYTDIYQIGALFHYLLTGHTKEKNNPEQLSKELGYIIYKCLRQDRCERYQSVLEIRQELEELYLKTGKFQQYQSTSLIIAFAGSRPGAGATHLAIGLCAYLNQQYCQCLYEEKNPTNDIRLMAQHLQKETDSYGIYTMFGIPLKPHYGNAVHLMRPCRYPILVQDYGWDWKAAAAAQGLTKLFLVIGGKWWDQKAGAQVVQKLKEAIRTRNVHGTSPDIRIIYNFTLPGIIKEFPGDFDCYRAPEYPNPFKPTEQARSFYEILVGSMGSLAKEKRRKALWESIKTLFYRKKDTKGKTREEAMMRKSL